MTNETACLRCYGKGFYTNARMMYVLCEKCGGTGEIAEEVNAANKCFNLLKEAIETIVPLCHTTTQLPPSSNHEYYIIREINLKGIQVNADDGSLYIDVEKYLQTVKTMVEIRRVFDEWGTIDSSINADEKVQEIGELLTKAGY